MSEKEMLEQLEELINDRKSFLTNDYESNVLFQKDIDALKKIIYDYNILRNAVYRSMEEKGENLNIWINENIKYKKVEIVNIWQTDYGDLKCNAILYQNKKMLADIVVGFDECTLKSEIQGRNTNSFFSNAFKSLIYNNFEQYLKLPEISKCSKLLQEIYDSVRDSEAAMCHITKTDWEKFYSDDFSNKDFENLKKEIKKYHLEDVIGINDCEYMIVGYGDLETRFNDDRNIEREREYEK